jgi:hypothetical protein
MKKLLLAIVVAPLSMTIQPAGSASAEVILEARQWAPDLSGQIRVDSSDLIDTIDLTQDLGLQDDEAFEGRLLVRPSKRTLFRVGWTPLTLTGEQVVSRTIVFLGREFDISSRVLSELELDYGRLGFAWQFLSTRDGRFRIGPLVEAKAFRGTATLSAPDLAVPATESAEFEVAFASAGLILDLEASDRLHIFAEGSVLLDESEGELNEIEVGVRFFATKALAIVAGVRQLEIDATDRDDLLQMDLEGAFAGLSLRF